MGNTVKAKSCFQEILDNDAARPFVDIQTEADLNLRKLEAAEKEANKAKQATLKDIQSTKEEFDADLKKLDDAKKMPNEQFIDFILTTFPPKHKDQFPRPDMSTPKAMKRALTRVVFYYHPDKVDSAEYGEGYKYFCGEITKILNGRLRRFKTM